MQERIVHCLKLGKDAPGMKFQPLPNELGKRIYDNISQEAWETWQQRQTMLINENRLNLSDIKAREYIMQQMEMYLFGTDSE